SRLLYALSGTFSGGNLGTTTLTINARPTGSAGGGYSGSSGSSGYQERDWSPSTRTSSERSSSEGPDLDDLLKPIGEMFTEAFQLLGHAVKPVQDVITEIIENWRRERLAQQVRRDTIESWRNIVAKKKAEEQALIWPGLQDLSEGEIAWWLGDERNDD